MAEQRSEEQILSAFETHSFGNSGAPATPNAPANQPAQPASQSDVAAQQTEVQPEAEATAEAKQEDQTEAVDTEAVDTIEIDPDEPLFEQEIDEGGKKQTQKLSLKELQQGYLRQADYTRKTQELAKQRAEAQEQVRQAVDGTSKQYAERLSQFQAALVKTVAPELANVDWNKLATEDAFEYVRLSNRAKQVNDVLQAVQAEKSQLEQRSKQEQEKKKADEWGHSLEILQKDIPQWGEPVAQRLAKAAQEVGFSVQEVADWSDHRLIKLAHKAAMYDDSQSKQSQEQKTIAQKKIALVPKAVLKPGAKPQATNVIAEARKQLRKTGKPGDALPIFEALVR